MDLYLLQPNAVDKASHVSLPGPVQNVPDVRNGNVKLIAQLFVYQIAQRFAGEKAAQVFLEHRQNRGPFLAGDAGDARCDDDVGQVPQLGIFDRRQSESARCNGAVYIHVVRWVFCVRFLLLLGAATRYFFSTASNEIVLPARTSFRADSMIRKNCGSVLNASDSRSTFLSDTKAATGRFFWVKTSVSPAESSAASRNDWNSLGSFIAFISLSPCLIRKDDFLV